MKQLISGTDFHNLLSNGSGEFTEKEFDFELNLHSQNPIYFIFNDCNFKKNIITGSPFNKSIDFNNCVFESNLNFANIKFQKSVSFTNCEFNGEVDFLESQFSEDVILENNKFNNKINFSKAIFNDGISLNYSKFKKFVNFFKANFQFISISCVTFKDDVCFSNIKNIDGLVSEESIFEKGTDFSNSRFDQNTRFFNNQFKGEANFSNTYFIKKANFNDSKFYNVVNFSNTKFNDKTRFKNVEFFEKANFENTTFKDLVDFYNSHFYKTNVFYKTDFMDTSVLSRTIFNENVLFTYSLIEGNMIFRHAEFKSGLDLSLANISGNLNFFNIIFEYFYSDKTPMNKKEYDEKVSIGDVIFDINKRETFRIIKDHYIRQNNKIDALKFHQLEMKAYSRELRKNFPLKKLDDRIINFLNFISNGYGLYWWVGGLFTLGISILFFYLSFSCLEENIHFTWKFYFNFLNPAHKIDYISDNLNICFCIWDFLGRIFISYGVYQTVSAFRKYNKK